MVLQRAALAGPTGGAVVEGSASISSAGNTTNINQSTNQAIINWQGFSISAQETVNFNQPSSSSVTLNRVVGNQQSVIAGALNANGQVFIINPGGVLFTKGSEVNVGGLVASTLDITNANFMAGNYIFSGPSQASVVNMGKIQASPGGYVALLGKTVSNEGAITATLGTVAMASGSKISLNFSGDSLIDVTIDEGVLNALVENKGAIKADGGRVILTAKAADAVLSAQVNNSGVIQARTMSALLGGSNTSGVGAGKRGAKGAGAGSGTTHVGSITLLASGGTVNVSGALDASAPKGGQGGTIETSGNSVTIADGAEITTKSASGQNGTWTIDPDGFTIGYRGDISSFWLSHLLGQTNITLASTDGRGIDGDIDVNGPVVWSANTVLTLNATNNININAPITATGASAGLVLNYGGYAATGTVTAGTNYYINNITTASDGSVIVSPASVTLSGANATLAINGQAYTLIHSMEQLEAISPNGGASANGFYALAQNLDASGTTFSGPVVSDLEGTLAGLGHKISNLTISDPIGQYFDALVSTAGSSAVVRDIGLFNVNVNGGTYSTLPPQHNSGSAAALVNMNNGSISNVYAINGSVSGFGGVGGLVATNNGAITNAHADLAVTGQSLFIGGLVATNNGVITYSSAKGSVNTSGSTGTNSGDIGGLVGMNANLISNSFATTTINVVDGVNVGGLVGYNNSLISYPPVATISNSYFAGSIYYTITNPNIGDSASVGGLVGLNWGGNVANSQTSGSIFLTNNSTQQPFLGQDIGGLVGYNEPSLFGDNGNITNSSANVNISISPGLGTFADIGGLVGTSVGGALSGDSAYGRVPVGIQGFSGGLVGQDFGSTTYSNNTFNATTTGQSNGVGGLGNVQQPSGVTAVGVPPSAAAVQTTLAATSAANVISTVDAQTTASTPPSGSQSAAGKAATSALAGPSVEDNITLEEPRGPVAPPSSSGRGRTQHAALGSLHAHHAVETEEAEEPPAPRHIAPPPKLRKVHVKPRGAGYGAHIRSIDVDGQHFDLENKSAKPAPALEPGAGAPEPGAGAPEQVQ